MGLIRYNAQPGTANAALFTSAVTPPTTLAYAAGTTGLSTFPGSVAYFWKVTFVNAYGETTASNEATGTPAATYSVTLTWATPPAGTTAVKVYRGTVTGQENALIATLGNVATYTDLGTAGVAATPPASAPVTLPLKKIIAINATASPVTLTLTIRRLISGTIENVTIPAGAVIPAGSAANMVEDRLLALDEIVLDPGDSLWGLASTGSAVTVVAFE